jgi:Fe2+ transport system protein FeoA
MSSQSKSKDRRLSRDGKSSEGAELTIIAPSKLAQELVAEKAVLQREIAIRQRRLASINRRLRSFGFLIRDQALNYSGDAKPLDPSKRLNLIDAIEQISNESANPISKAEIRQRLRAMGLPLENFNNYFYVAIRRLRSRRRISVLEDGRIWRP